MLEATAVNTIEFTCLVSCHSSSKDVFFHGDGCWGNCKFWAFWSKDISSGVLGAEFFLERWITYLTWIPEEVEGTTPVVDVLAILQTILECVVEALEMRYLNILIQGFQYCRSVFSLLLKNVF